MVQYAYRAVNGDGQMIRGSRSAVNDADLISQLESIGLELIDFKVSKRMPLATLLSSVSARDMIQMFIHLQQLQAAGAPVLEGLVDIRDSTDKPRLRDIVDEIHRAVSEGVPFSQACARHPKYFEPLTISLIEAGEVTGNMSEAFTQIIRHMKWTEDMRARIKKATRYPMVIGVVMAGVIMFMMGVVVPELTKFLKSQNIPLPGLTLAVIAFSDFIVDYWWTVIAVPAGLTFLIKFIVRTSEAAAYRADYITLRLPIVGNLTRKFALARFAHTFAMMFNSGIDIQGCLDSATRTAGNRVLSAALRTVSEQVGTGTPLSQALKMSGEFPSLVVRMVKIGEDTGTLSNVLGQVAEFYSADVDAAIEGLIGMIEPMLTVAMGLIMAIIIVAIAGPIYMNLGNMGGSGGGG